MDGLHEMTGAGVPLEIGGTVYNAKPLRAKDWAEAGRYLNSRRKKPLDIVKEHLHGLPLPLQQYLLDIAYRDERQGELVGMLEIHVWFSTPEGQAFRLWLLLRQDHPDVSLERAEELFALSTREQKDKIGDAAHDGMPVGNSSGRAKNPAKTQDQPELAGAASSAT